MIFELVTRSFWAEISIEAQPTQIKLQQKKKQQHIQHAEDMYNNEQLNSKWH